MVFSSSYSCVAKEALMTQGSVSWQAKTNAVCLQIIIVFVSDILFKLTSIKAFKI